MPDWSREKRQRVRTDQGRDLVLYVQNGRVITVYEVKLGVPQRMVFGNFVQ
jgi:hypothetical protein